MNQRNTITIGRVVLHLLGREPVDVGSLEVELTIPVAADVPVEKPAAELSDWNRRVLGIMKAAPEPWKATVTPPLEPQPVVERKPAIVAAAESMEATARAIGALVPEPAPEPLQDTSIPLQPPRPQTAERTSPVLEQFRLHLLATVPAGGHVDGTANFFGDAVPEWEKSGASQRYARAHYWLQYLLTNPQYGLQVERVGVKPTVWRVLRSADEGAVLPPLSELATITMERIRTMLAADLDALDGTTKAICTRLDCSDATALAAALRELVLHELIDFEAVSDNAGGEYWRVDLAGGAP
jgi:hypothetical protein